MDKPQHNPPPAFLTSEEALSLLNGYYILDVGARQQVRDFICELLAEAHAALAESERRSPDPSRSP